MISRKYEIDQLEDSGRFLLTNLTNNNLVDKTAPEIPGKRRGSLIVPTLATVPSGIEMDNEAFEISEEVD